MLGKILKYDLQATGRLLVPAYLLFIAISAVNKIFLELGIQNEFESTSLVLTQGLTFTLYFITIVAISVITTVFVVMHFYKTMAGEQGYMTHTLPVKTDTLVISKILCSLFWQAIVGLLVFSSVGLLLLGHVEAVSSFFRDNSGFLWSGLWRELQETFNFELSFYSIIIALKAIVAAVMTPVTYFACIAIGNLSNKHKVMNAVLAYVVYYIGSGVIRLMINIVYSVFTVNMSSEAILSADNYKMIFDLFVNIVITMVLYLVTVHIFKKKLNLE